MSRIMGYALPLFLILLILAGKTPGALSESENPVEPLTPLPDVECWYGPYASYLELLSGPGRRPDVIWCGPEKLLWEATSSLQAPRSLEALTERPSHRSLRWEGALSIVGEAHYWQKLAREYRKLQAQTPTTNFIYPRGDGRYLSDYLMDGNLYYLLPGGAP